jgi:hypothetical protein
MKCLCEECFQMPSSVSYINKLIVFSHDFSVSSFVRRHRMSHFQITTILSFFMANMINKTRRRDSIVGSEMLSTSTVTMTAFLTSFITSFKYSFMPFSSRDGSIPLCSDILSSYFLAISKTLFSIFCCIFAVPMPSSRLCSFSVILLIDLRNSISSDIETEEE